MPASHHFVLWTFLEPDGRSIPGRASISIPTRNTYHPEKKNYSRAAAVVSIVVHRALAGDAAMELPRKAMASTLVVVWLLLLHSCKHSPLLPFDATSREIWSSDKLTVVVLDACARMQGCRCRVRTEPTTAGSWTATTTATASGRPSAGRRAPRTTSSTGAARKGSPTCCPSASACARSAHCAAAPQPERPADMRPSSDRSRHIARPRRMHSERGENEWTIAATLWIVTVITIMSEINQLLTWLFTFYIQPHRRAHSTWCWGVGGWAKTAGIK